MPNAATGALSLGRRRRAADLQAKSAGRATLGKTEFGAPVDAFSRYHCAAKRETTVPYYLARLQGHYNVQIQLQRGGVGYVPFTSQAAAVQNVQQYNHGVVYDPWNRVVFQAGQGVAAVPSSYQAPQTQGVPPSATGYWQVFTADGRRSIKYTDPNLALQNHRNNPGGRLVANVAAPPPRWAYLTNTVLT